MGSKQKKKSHDQYLCSPFSLWSLVLRAGQPGGSRGWVCVFSPLHAVRPRPQPPALGLGSDEPFPFRFPRPRQCCSVQQLASVGKLYSNNQDIPISPPGEGVYVPGIFNLFAIRPIYEVIVQVTLSLSHYILVYKILVLVL